ncbi:MAG: ribosome maturation factor RimM [Desulfobulbaceae bacterium]|jgi:16S rRNA processing protein RimM|nr:ribosome maturation factor RimM [Desulfobulbaceae bacterium]
MPDERLNFLGEYSSPEHEIVILGVVAKARGLKGEVAFQPLSRQPATFCRYRAVRLGDGRGNFSRPIPIAACRVVKNTVAFRLVDVETRERAEALVGCVIAVDARDLPAPEEDEYYWRELIGLDVCDADMKRLGAVTALFDNGAHGVLVVAGDNGEEFLLPMVRSVISQTTIDGRQLLVLAPISGLLDANRDA